MIAALLAAFGHCRHDRIGPVITPIARRNGVGIFGARGQSYCVCLRCSKDLAYSLEEMRVTGEIAPAVGRRWDEGKAEA